MVPSMVTAPEASILTAPPPWPPALPLPPLPGVSGAFVEPYKSPPRPRQSLAIWYATCELIAVIAALTTSKRVPANLSPSRASHAASR